MRKNNVINTEGLIGEANIMVRWQGTRTVCKKEYHDIDEFNSEWISIDKFWSREEPQRAIKFNKGDKELINKFLARTKAFKLDK